MSRGESVGPEQVAALLLAECSRRRCTLRAAAQRFFSSKPGLSFLKPVVRVLTLGVARNYRLLDYLVEEAGLPKPLDAYRLNLARVVAYEVAVQGVRKPRLERLARAAGLGEKAPALLSQLDWRSEVRRLARLGRLDIAYSVPRWVLLELRKARVPNPRGFLESLLSEPTRWLRVSTHRISREQLARALAERGIAVEPDRDLPDVLRVLRGSGLGSTPEYRAGLYVVQDKASAAVCHALPRGGVVVDFTGGPGVKATHAAQLGAQLSIAGDVDPRRAKAAAVLSTRLGLGAAVSAAVWDCTMPPVRPAAVVAIVDPTCSNLGRLRYEPEIKMWIRRVDVERCARRQARMLRSVLSALPRGSLVCYSVCSWSRAECEDVVEKVLDLAEPVDHGLGFALGGGVRGSARFYPHVHDTLGFFLALLRRV